MPIRLSGVTSWRNYILKALLGALAVTAVAGVIGVVSSEETMWRIGGTSFTAAVASVLLLWVSKFLDQPSTRAAGLAGAAGVTLEFFLFTMLIWEMHRIFPGDEGQLLATAAVFAVATVATMAFLRMLPAPATRVAGMVGLASTAAAGGAALLASWWPRGAWNGLYWRAVESLWGTSLAADCLGVLAVAALVGLGTDRRHWRWIGIGAAAIAFVIAEYGIWTHTSSDGKALAPPSAVAAWVALAIPLLRVELAAQRRWLRAATLVAGAAAACLWVLAVLDFDSDVVWRSGAASTILTGCGTLAIVVIARLGKRVDTADLPRELRSVTLFCPRCSRKQTQPLGAAACAACGLKIEVKAEQPACSQCGYLLYGTDAARCPECGTPVVRPAQAA